MHVPDLKHEFGIGLHILAQIVICSIHKVTEFAPRDVVEILWDELRFDAFFEKFPRVAMVLPFLLPHCPPPCGGIAFQVRLGKLHNQVLPNFGGMNVVFHFRKPSIHNLSVIGPIEVPRLSGLETRIFG
jgi:hypothetical protein